MESGSICIELLINIGFTMEFLLRAKRDGDAAKAFLGKLLSNTESLKRLPLIRVSQTNVPLFF